MPEVLREIKINILALKEQALAERVYVGNFWSDLASTALFTITYLVFIDLLFRRVGSIGTFSKNDMFFMLLLGQATFYIWSQCILTPMLSLVDKVRSGNLDFVLLKPLAVKPFLYFSAIKPYYTVFTSLPNILLVIFLINWHQLTLSPLSVVIGMIVWISGMIITTAFMLFMTLPVFKQGDANDMLAATYALMTPTYVPFDALPSVMRTLSFGLLPTLLTTAAAAQVILQKGSVVLVFIPAVAAGLVSLYATKLMWQYVFRNYTSASS